MKAQKNKKAPDYMNVKVPGELWLRLIKHKEETFIPISKAVEKAVNDYLDKSKTYQP